MRRRNPIGHSQMTMSEARGYLGLDPTATASQAKRAFRDAAKKHHPDVGGDAELFKRIAEAYEVLSGRTIPAPERPTRPATPPTPPPPPPARSENYHPSAQFVLRVSLAEPGRKTRGLGALNSIIAAAESIYGARQFPQIIVCVYSDAGPYISSLRDLIVDLWNDRDILTGPAHPPEPSVWDED